ncbi:uncharacterized protein LY79DRAFT_128696 [Colletotrichum navitas]|uniref:Uncharacterized protein n=1 Tax=Colletotrichum navitas TaxID=681940 RepID=A0AAD8Q4F0_9PEZI|nr:uncharacterized protein LY79DRAFT_128696 [Colletotrichum navitas]KAK1594867.1 hypothetical protein LY79DRAFT_128696 [Colletotrichum navitas]
MVSSVCRSLIAWIVARYERFLFGPSPGISSAFFLASCLFHEQLPLPSPHRLPSPKSMEGRWGMTENGRQVFGRAAACGLMTNVVAEWNPSHPQPRPGYDVRCLGGASADFIGPGRGRVLHVPVTATIQVWLRWADDWGSGSACSWGFPILTLCFLRWWSIPVVHCPGFFEWATASTGS